MMTLRHIRLTVHGTKKAHLTEPSSFAMQLETAARETMGLYRTLAAREQVRNPFVKPLRFGVLRQIAFWRLLDKAVSVAFRSFQTQFCSQFNDIREATPSSRSVIPLIQTSNTI